MPGQEFDVALEVKPQGAVRGTRELANATKELTAETRRSGEETRKTRTAEQELAEAERRRMAAAAELIRTTKAQITSLAEYQRQLLATASAESARAAAAARAQRSTVSSTGVDPSSRLGGAMTALLERERQLRAGIQEAAAELARSDKVAGNIAGLQARTKAMEGALAAAKRGEDAEREYAAAMEAARAVEASGARPGTDQAAAVEKEVRAQQRLEAELRAVAAARERDRRAAREAEAQRDRVAGEITRLRETTRQLEILAVAHRKGGAAVREANVQLEIRNTLLRNGVAAGSADAQAIEREIRAHARLRQQIDQGTAAKQRMEQGGQMLRRMFLALQAAVLAVGITALVRDSVNVALALERTSKTFVAVTGTSQGAGREMAFVRAEAERLGLVLTNTAQSYASLMAASRGTVLEGQATRDIFSAISEAATVLGLSSDQASGALQAIQQMISKGTVQAEELRGQLGERLPGAFQLAARAMGVTTAELGKMLEGGKVLASDLLPKLATELRRTFGAGLTTAVTSFQANLNRLKNDVDELKGSLGRGFLEGFMAGFSDLRAAITDAELGQAARDLGESLGQGLRVAADAAAWLAKNLELVKAVLIVILGLKVASFFVVLATAIVAATGKTIVFKSALAGLAVAGPLAVIGVLLLGATIAMDKYTSSTRAAHAAEMEKVARSNEVNGYYLTLKANKEGLTKAEWDYGRQVRQTMAAELAAMQVSLARAKAVIADFGIKDTFNFPKALEAHRAKRDMPEMTREIQTIQNQIAFLDKEWYRLANLPVIDLKVESGGLDKSGQKVTDLLEQFRRAAEQAERIAAAQKVGADAAHRVTQAIERENAAYGALNSLEGVSAATKARLTKIIDGLVGRTQAANLAAEATIALRERDAEYANQALEVEARLSDAKAGNTEATRQLAAALAAQAIAAKDNRSEDAAYLALLTDSIRARNDYLSSIEAQIEAEERQRAHQEELWRLQAELADVMAGSTANVRRHTALLEAEAQIRKLSADEAARYGEQIRRDALLRAEETREIQAQIAAKQRLIEATLRERQIRAEVTDFITQAAAARRFGQEIAGILASYGLLSQATRELAIQEEIVTAIREEQLDLTTQAGFLRSLQIEAEIQGQHRVLKGIDEYMARMALAARVNEPINDAWRQTGEVIKSSVVDVLLSAFGEAEFSFEDFLRNLLRMWAQAMVEMFARWLATQKAMAATNLATGGGGGGGGAGWMSTLARMFSGGGGAAAGGAATTGGYVAGTGVTGGMTTIGMTGGSTAAAGGASAASVGSALGVAFIAAVGLMIVYKTFVEKGVEWAEMSTRGGRLGNSKDVKATVGRRVQQIIAEVTEISKAMDLGITQIGEAWLGKRGNVYYVRDAINTVGMAFGSVEQAMDFLRVRAIQLAEFSDETSQFIQAAIQGSRAQTMEALSSDIDFARALENRGKPQLQVDLSGFYEAFHAEWTRAMDLFRRDATQLGQALTQIGVGLNTSLQSVRNQLTGAKPDEEAERRRSIALYNAQIKLIRAELQARLIEINSRIAGIRAMLLHGEAATNLSRTMIVGADATQKAMGISSGAALATLASLEAQSAAIQALLDALPEEITDEEAARTRRRASGGGGRRGERREGREEIREEIGGLGLGEVAASIRDARAAFADLQERIRAAGFSAAEAQQLMGRASEQLAADLLKLKNEVLVQAGDFIGRGSAMAGLPRDLQDVQREADGLIGSLDELVEAGLLAERRFENLAEQIRAASRGQQEQLLTGGVNSLLGNLYGLLGMEKEGAQLRFDLTVQELQMRRAELALSMQLLSYTEERMAAILGPIDKLIGKVIAAGPSIFDRSGQPSDGNLSAEANRLAEENAKRMRDAVERFRGAVQSLVESQQKLLLDDELSPLTPEERMAEALRQYEANLAKANAGDVQAIADFGEFQKRYLEATKFFFGAGQDQLGQAGYLEAFQRTMADANSLAQNADLERRTIERIMSEAAATNQAFAAQNHRDLTALRAEMQLLAESMGGRVLARADAFLAAADAEQGTKAAGAPLTSPADGSGAVVAELREIRREVVALRAERKTDASTRIAQEEVRNEIARQERIARLRELARPRRKA